MINSEKYKVWFSLRVVHDYYESDYCPIRMKILPDTLHLFKKYGILCRRTKFNQWSFLTQNLEIEEDEDTANLYFELIPEDNILHYLTDVLINNQEEKNYEIKFSTEINKWINLIIPIGKHMTDIDISLNSKSKYLEYIIINRYQKDNIKQKIEEKQKRIKFTESQIVEDLSLGEGFCIISTNKIKIKQSYKNFTLQLFEIKNNGERILCNNLPFPKPQEASLLRPYDTITAYYYI